MDKLEALLFIYGEPVAIKKIARVLGIKEDRAKEKAEKLEKSLKEDKRGLSLIFHKEKIQLVTRPDLSPLLEKIFKDDVSEALTPATLETLSIIAYGAPIGRSEIDYIRGVNSTFTLRSLLLRGLIEREVDSNRGNAYIYSLSFNFIKHIGLSKIENLPEYEKFRDLAKNLSSSNSEEKTE